MKGILLFFFLLCFAHQVSAQQAYAASEIPAELLPRASAVVRHMEMNIEVKSPKQVLIRVKKAVTVLNESGDQDARIYIWYNKDHKIRSAKGLLYDEFGNPTAKFSEKNFSDQSAASNSSLFEDSRIKQFSPANKVYPYTIEYEYEIDAKQSLNFPDWYPHSSTGVAVEYASLNLISNSDYTFRYKEFNYPGRVDINEIDGKRTYQWEVKGLKAFRSEPYSPDPEHYLTSVKIAPDHFNYLGVDGSFSDWQSYGKWMYETLLKDRDKIPEQTARYIQSITKDIDDPKEKARKIYEYMQQKTRYVSIQVGIGGYQPFLASEVDHTHYGDCKALVNYTQGLLKTAGIESYYVIVASGDRKKSAIPDFASMNQFDHVILAVPFENDTLWADCTSKENPFGYLGTFTDDRWAVACTPEGGKLIRTPQFEKNTSKQSRIANFQLDSLGNLKGQMETHFGGWQYDNRDFMISEVYTEQLKKIPEVYRINNIETEQFQLEQHKSQYPVTVEKIRFAARNYGALNNDLMFVPLNKVNQSPMPPEVRNRENPLYINRSYIDVDSLTFDLPAGYAVDYLPPAVFTEHAWGSFRTTLEIRDQKVHYTRRIELEQGNYPAQEYAQLVEFYRTVANADGARMVLKQTD